MVSRFVGVGDAGVVVNDGVKEGFAGQGFAVLAFRQAWHGSLVAVCSALRTVEAARLRAVRSATINIFAATDAGPVLFHDQARQPQSRPRCQRGVRDTKAFGV